MRTMRFVSNADFPDFGSSATILRGSGAVFRLLSWGGTLCFVLIFAECYLRVSSLERCGVNSARIIVPHSLVPLLDYGTIQHRCKAPNLKKTRTPMFFVGCRSI